MCGSVMPYRFAYLASCGIFPVLQLCNKIILFYIKSGVEGVAVEIVVHITPINPSPLITRKSDIFWIAWCRRKDGVERCFSSQPNSCTVCFTIRPGRCISSACVSSSMDRRPSVIRKENLYRSIDGLHISLTFRITSSALHILKPWNKRSRQNTDNDDHYQHLYQRKTFLVFLHQHMSAKITI